MSTPASRPPRGLTISCPGKLLLSCSTACFHAGVPRRVYIPAPRKPRRARSRRNRDRTAPGAKCFRRMLQEFQCFLHHYSLLRRRRCLAGDISRLVESFRARGPQSSPVSSHKLHRRRSRSPVRMRHLRRMCAVAATQGRALLRDQLLLRERVSGQTVLRWFCRSIFRMPALNIFRTEKAGHSLCILDTNDGRRGGMFSTGLRDYAGLFSHQSRRQTAAFKDGQQFEKDD